ncbi:kinase-like protein [Exidia glandulosa HHB12029]|uniref:Kinase-like protein n=1 Tax=Exidia glandulosa HHB12029 TaxID=1314781 RepID=A0A165DUB9_EXIGL|nr:kinase-like protein [Exidia glandulosa HHB12029]
MPLPSPDLKEKGTLVDVPDLTDQITNLSRDPLGWGGFSNVHSAEWISPHGRRKVAVKILRVRSEDYAKTITLQTQRLKREVAVWKRLEHRHVQPLLGLHWKLGALPALVSPLQGNGDVKRYLSRMADDPNIHDIRFRMLQANVLVSKDGIARLTDFGFSSMRIQASVSFSESSTWKGTVRFMAPELVMNITDRYTPASDIWASGCLILEANSERPKPILRDNKRCGCYYGATPEAASIAACFSHRKGQGMAPYIKAPRHDILDGAADAVASTVRRRLQKQKLPTDLSIQAMKALTKAGYIGKLINRPDSPIVDLLKLCMTTAGGHRMTPNVRHTVSRTALFLLDAIFDNDKAFKWSSEQHVTFTAQQLRPLAKLVGEEDERQAKNLLRYFSNG